MAIRKDYHSEHERLLLPLQQELKGDVNSVRSPRVSQEWTSGGPAERDEPFSGQVNVLSSMKEVCQLAGTGMLSQEQ